MNNPARAREAIAEVLKAAEDGCSTLEFGYESVRRLREAINDLRGIYGSGDEALAQLVSYERSRPTTQRIAVPLEKCDVCMSPSFIRTFVHGKWTCGACASRSLWKGVRMKPQGS